MENKCEMCGVCCQIFLINLNEDEYLSGKFKTVNEDVDRMDSFTEAEKYGLNFLAQKEDGSCIYLTGNACGVHKERPQVCREFFCASTETKFDRMIKEIKERKGI